MNRNLSNLFDIYDEDEREHDNDQTQTNQQKNQQKRSQKASLKMQIVTKEYLCTDIISKNTPRVDRQFLQKESQIKQFPETLLVDDFLPSGSFLDEQFIDPSKIYSIKFKTSQNFLNWLNKSIIDTVRKTLLIHYKNLKIITKNEISDKYKLVKPKNYIIKQQGEKQEFLVDNENIWNKKNYLKRKVKLQKQKSKLCNQQINNKKINTSLSQSQRQMIYNAYLNGENMVKYAKENKINTSTVRTTIHKIRQGLYDLQKNKAMVSFQKLTNSQLQILNKYIESSSKFKIIAGRDVKKFILNLFDIDLEMGQIQKVLNFLNFKSKRYSTSEKLLSIDNKDIVFKHFQNIYTLSLLLEKKVKLYSCDESYFATGDSCKRSQSKRGKVQTLFKPKHGSRQNTIILSDQNEIKCFQVSLLGQNRFNFATFMFNCIDTVTAEKGQFDSVILMDSHPIHYWHKLLNQVKDKKNIKIFSLGPYLSQMDPCEQNLMNIKRHQYKKYNYSEQDAISGWIDSVFETTKKECNMAYLFSARIWIHQFDEIVSQIQRNYKDFGLIIDD